MNIEKMASKNEESSTGKVICDGELSNQTQQTSFEFVVEKILGSFVDKVRNNYSNKFLIKIVYCYGSSARMKL